MIKSLTIDNKTHQETINAFEINLTRVRMAAEHTIHSNNYSQMIKTF